MAQISIAEFEKAVRALQVALKFSAQAPSTVEFELMRDACIQRFEFCIELAWKISTKTLGLKTNAPRTAVREMAQNGLIQDPKQWFDFIEARNKTSHTYDEKIAQAVFQSVQNFMPEAEALLAKLKAT